MQSFQQDLIRELRLRRWARLNYVLPEKRCASWHPVVLEEMQSRDTELADRAIRPHSTMRYVPLPPTPGNAAAPGTGAATAPPSPHTAFAIDHVF